MEMRANSRKESIKVHGFGNIDDLLRWCLPVQLKLKFDVSKITKEEACLFLNSLQHDN